ncbi:MAG: hypothetical protein IID44_26870 [Planctomycetes bacterium]|nr:hypothetical protein [Planctomycetota bacterium]
MPQKAQIDEGFSLEFTPLLSIDGPGRADAVVFVQSKGKLKTASTPRRRRSASRYRRRF